jgi:hypothetical protein
VLEQRANAAADQYGQADAHIKSLEKQHTKLMEEGDFAQAAGLQRQIAATALQQEQARQQYLQLNQLRNVDPVEQYLAVNRGQFSAQEEQWIREHPEYARDPQFQRQIIEAHQEATGDGYKRGSAGYFVRLNAAADRLVGEDAHAASAPLLTGDRLDMARGVYMAANPDKDGRDDREVSRWWGQQGHSAAASRLRERWLDYGS